MADMSERAPRVSTSTAPVDDPLDAIARALAEVARVRGWLSLGDHARAEQALDRAMVALTHAEDTCPASARGAIERAHADLDAAVSRA